MAGENRIYLDNAATSFPKAPRMGEAIADFLENSCVNLYRTESRAAQTAFDFVDDLREKIARLYNYPRKECVIFKSSVTEALNWLLKGLLRVGDHALVTSLEHNAVMRPLVQMGIDFDRIPCDEFGFTRVDAAENLLRANTRAIIATAASNVFGSVQPLAQIAALAKKRNLTLIVDSAQASPFVDIDMTTLDAAAVAFTGHKNFLGPHGTGGFVLRKDLALTMNPLIAGGTGSASDSEKIPATLPDRLSPGTPNLVGLVGLNFALGFVLPRKDEIAQKTRETTEYLYRGLQEIRGVKIVGATLEMPRTNAISIVCPNFDIGDLCAKMNEMRGIETRVGMHCAPSAHKALNTFPQGTLRFSPGFWTTKEEIDITLETMENILRD